MNKYLKQFLFILAALVYYFVTTIGFAVALTNINLAAGWLTFLTLVVLLIIVVPTVLVIVFSLLGMLDNWGQSDKEEIDEELLVHAVMNQVEVDFSDQKYNAMSQTFQTLISDERGSIDVLHEYLSKTAQEQLKAGLIIKRRDNE